MLNANYYAKVDKVDIEKGQVMDQRKGLWNRGSTNRV